MGVRLSLMGERQRAHPARGPASRFRSVFAHTSIWLTTEYSVLLGTPDPLEIDLRRVNWRLESPAVRASLAEVGLGDPAALLHERIETRAATAKRYNKPRPTCVMPPTRRASSSTWPRVRR